MSTIKAPATPAIFDKALAAYNQKLQVYFPWLTAAYGMAQHLAVKNDKGRVERFPGIYTGDGKRYINLFPASSMGNFTWWDLGPYKINPVTNQMEYISADFGLVVWFNIAKVLPIEERRNIEQIKAEFLAFFRQARVLDTRLTVGQITTLHRDLYKGFDLKEVEEQYLMHPYAAIRFNGTIKVGRLCQ